MTEVDLGSPSTSGAFNGTAISTINRYELDDAYHLFYQHYDGRLKHLVSPNPRIENWTESSDSRTLPSNTRDRTPLATFIDGDSLYLFYVDNSHRVQHATYLNGSQKWQRSQRWQPWLGSPRVNGTSNTLLVASDTLLIAFEAERESGEEPWISFLYGSDDGLVHKIYLYYYNTTSYYLSDNQAFARSNGCSGVVSLTAQGDVDLRYIFTVDRESLQIQSWTNIAAHTSSGFWGNISVPSSDDPWIQGKPT